MSDTDEEQLLRRRRRRVCDLCGRCTAVLYCRADSAKHCLSCDRKVHSNQLLTKHTRSLLCDVCDSSAASIFCSTDASVLCHNCDYQSHYPPVSPPHDRRTVEGFAGSLSPTELIAILGFEDVDCTVPADSAIDLEVALPKNQNVACGRHRDDILCQLRDLLKLEPNSTNNEKELETSGSFQSMEPQIESRFGNKSTGLEQNIELTLAPSSEGSASQCCITASKSVDQEIASLFGESTETNSKVPDKDSGGGDGGKGHSHNSTAKDTSQKLPKASPPEPIIRDRETALSRYKEKRKNRRFENQIRYESRKLRAESRARINGRFVKKDQGDTDTSM